MVTNGSRCNTVCMIVLYGVTVDFTLPCWALEGLVREWGVWWGEWEVRAVGAGLV